MIGNAGGLEVLGLVVIVLFVVVMVAGLIFSRRTQTRSLRDINAAVAWAQLGGRSTNGASLLYGVWQTTMRDVVLVVRDEHDVTVGTITQSGSGTVIETGSGSFAVISTSGMSQSAELRAAASDTAAAPMCRFEARGWAGNRVASYTAPGATTFTIRARWLWARQRGALPVLQDGRAAGRLCALGGPTFDRGRALFLAADISLPIRLFMLWKGMGVQRPGVAR